MSLYGLLGRIEANGLWDTATKEVVGINAPKILIARSWDERIDTAVSEIGNTVGFLGAGAAVDKGLEKLFHSAEKAGGNQAKWAQVGRSFALSSVIFSVMWAMPFIRNYVTTWRTGATDFTQVIGVKDKSLQHKQTAQAQAAMADSRNKALATLGLGLGAAAAIAGGARYAAGKKLGLGLLEGLFSKKWLKPLLLKGGSFRHFEGVPALLFWGVPAYGGWIHASRDNYERKEQLLKFAGFTACFFGPQLAMKKFFERKTAGLLPKGVDFTYKSLTGAIAAEGNNVAKQNLEKALGYWKTKSAAGLLSSILLLGTVPQVLNIFLTRQRLAKAAAQPTFAAMNSPFANASGLQRKSFDQWTRVSRQAG